MPSFRPPPADRAARTRCAIALCALALLVGCGARDSGAGAGADGSPTGGSCELDDQLAWVDASMRDYYLFYDQVPTVRRSDHSDTASLLQALRVPPDSFSFITDAARSAALFDEGERVGYGWKLTRRADRALMITLVEIGSPLDLAGVRRGEVIRSINGLDEPTMTQGQYAEQLGSGDEVRTVRLGIEAIDGSLRTVQVTRERYSVRGVQQLDIVERGALRIGYLNFLTFIEPASAELDRAFAELADVDELVLDLRFNGGGRISVANQLASRVGGAGVQGRDFTRFRYNDRAAGIPPEGLPQPFLRLADSLDLARVYVLSGPGTCSAAEMVINGLEPFVDVITIGGATCGKPYGFRANERCGEALFAVEIAFVNDAGVGDYVDGLSPDCAVMPDGRTPLGTVAEPLFAAALQHIESATCSMPAVQADGLSDARRRPTSGPIESPATRNPVDPFVDDLPPR